MKVCLSTPLITSQKGRGRKDRRSTTSSTSNLTWILYPGGLENRGRARTKKGKKQKGGNKSTNLRARVEKKKKPIQGRPDIQCTTLRLSNRSELRRPSLKKRKIEKERRRMQGSNIFRGHEQKGETTGVPVLAHQSKGREGGDSHLLRIQPGEKKTTGKAKHTSVDFKTKGGTKRSVPLSKSGGTGGGGGGVISGAVSGSKNLHLHFNE